MKPRRNGAGTALIVLNDEHERVRADNSGLRPISTRSAGPVSDLEVARKAGNEGHNQRRAAAFVNQSYLLNSDSTAISGSSLIDDARAILTRQPSNEELQAVLQYLNHGIEGRHDFDVRVTSARSAQLVNVLVTTTVPDVWPTLRGRKLVNDEIKLKRNIIACLTSATGIGGLLTQVKLLSNHLSNNANTARLSDTISALAHVLKGTKTVLSFLRDATELYDQQMQRRLFWQEIASLISGGRILSIAAQALSILDQSLDTFGSISWLGDGREYSDWLAANISTAAAGLQVSDTESWPLLGQLLKRGLNMGYRDLLVTKLYTSLLLGPHALWKPLHSLLKTLSPLEQTIVFDAILQDLSRTCLGGGSSFLGFDEDLSLLNQSISAVAALISELVKDNDNLKEHMENWLVISSPGYATIGLAARRSLMAILAKSVDKLEHVLQKVLTNFADKVQIQHSTVPQQDACAQTVLLAISHLKESGGNKILRHPNISSLIMRSVSHRLGASAIHARFLGMVVGTAFSRVVDAPNKILDFGVDEMKGEEAHRWLRLVGIIDTVAGDVYRESLFAFNPALVRTLSESRKQSAVSRLKKKGATPFSGSRVIAIEEVSDTGLEQDTNSYAGNEKEEDDDPDLIPYGKPDSDPSDSDEDPTLINRARPSAPVYIASLIAQLADSNPDISQLALETAPSLIRRKTGFGTELTDGLQALTSTLISIQDGMSQEDLAQLRLDSLIACMLAKPEVMGPYLVASYFEGDHSVSQRVVILTALGLSARELAGFRDTSGDSASNRSPSVVNDSQNFPSKRLPPHLEQKANVSPVTKSTTSKSTLKPLQSNAGPPLETASQASNLINALVLSYTKSTIQPMALQAADKLSGPAALKVSSSRTFSSRLEVESRRRQQQEDKKQKHGKSYRHPNLHDILVRRFYLELSSRLTLLLSYASASVPTVDNFTAQSTPPSMDVGRFTLNQKAQPKLRNTTLLSPQLLTLCLQTLTLILHTLGPSISSSLQLPLLTQETVHLLMRIHTLPVHLSTDPLLLPAILHLFLSLLDVTTESGTTAQERLIVDHGTAVAELMGWINALDGLVPTSSSSHTATAGGRTPESDLEKLQMQMPWNILAAGIQVKWHEIGQRFQGRMLGLQRDDEFV